jgi:hypothetical protein
MDQSMSKWISQWRRAWICLALAIGLHVADEALTGFLPVYNRVVGTLRTNHPWVPLPIFTFSVWLGCLILLVFLLLGMTPLFSRRQGWGRVVSIVISVLMIGNSLVHIGASAYWGKLAPGVYSSPFLLGAALALFITSMKYRPERY